MDHCFKDKYGDIITTRVITSVTDRLNLEGYESLRMHRGLYILEKNIKEYFTKKYATINHSFNKQNKDNFSLLHFYESNIGLVIAVSEDMIYQAYYKVEANLEDIVRMLELITFEKTDESSKVSIIIKTIHGFRAEPCDIKPYKVDVKTMYNDDFLPVYDKMIESLSNKDKGVLLLHGAPGTGKTSLIKYLTTIITHKKFIFIPTNLIGYLIDPSFLEFLLTLKNSILVLEDCENYIKERGVNGNDAVSTLLNLSDGIMSDILKIQIICTFNGKVTDIDQALLRKGRLIAEYEFKALEETKAEKLAEELGVTLSKETTLTSIFNVNEDEFKSEKKQRVAVGF